MPEPIKWNKGDTAEGILTCAITARFMSKTKRITDNDVYSVIKKIKDPKKVGAGITSETTFPSPNKDTKVPKDDVICFINLAEKNMFALMNKSLQQSADYKNIVKASVQYANGIYIMDWADMMYTNNVYNKIEVRSEGLLDQTGTKVDLKVVIDGKQAGVGVSLKEGDVKQFGQVSGKEWEVMENLFTPLGVTFSNSFQAQYEKILYDGSNKKAPVDAITTAYKEAARQLKLKKQPFLRKSLADFMKEHATRGEGNVILLQLSRKEATAYDFELLERALKDKNITIDDSVFTNSQVIPNSRLPKIIFKEKESGKDILIIRNFLSGNRINSKGKRIGLTVRNLIEKGKKTTDLIAESAK